jgi:DNA-binding HxlR family transcriptional regulator
MATPYTVYKLIVLYMLNNSEDALTNSQLSEFILDREYTNYFHLQQAISELEESELLEKKTISNTSYYQLTEDGRNTLSYFEDELSPAIKKEVQDYLKKNGCQIEKRILAPADFYVTPQGNYDVRCRLIEKNTILMDINISAPNLEAAKSMCQKWPEKYQDIYGKIMEELL